MTEWRHTEEDQGHTPPRLNRRREYRGDQHRPVVDRALVHAWIKSYEAQYKLHPATCDRVAEKYEQRLGRYGYSLKKLRSVLLSSFAP